jgi:hypothetical protein
VKQRFDFSDFQRNSPVCALAIGWLFHVGGQCRFCQPFHTPNLADARQVLKGLLHCESHIFS